MPVDSHDSRRAVPLQVRYTKNHMTSIHRSALAILLPLLAAAAGAEISRPFLGVDAMVGTPSAMKDVFRTAFPGASLRYIASPHLEFSLDYAFMETEYYYPESGSGPWVGPAEWSSVPGRFGDLRSSWIFYHTKHFIAPQAWYVASLEGYGAPLALRLGAGPAISLLKPNEAAKYYPGLSDAFEQFRSSFKAYLGLSVRLGLEYRPWSFFRVGVEYLFIVDSLSQMAADASRSGLDYFRNSGNFIVFTGIRI